MQLNPFKNNNSLSITYLDCRITESFIYKDIFLCHVQHIHDFVV